MSLWDELTVGNMTTSYTYDYAGRVTYINNYSPYLTAKSTHTYAYDNAGNIIKATETMFGHDTAVTTYTYDSINRLSEENGVDWKMYRYDEYNNLTAAVGYGDIYYYYDANNRLIKLEDQWTSGETADGIKPDDWQTDYVYDNNGKLLSSSKNSAPGCYGYVSNQKSYTYDVWGRLTGYSDSLGESGTYTYYPDGLRRSKTVESDTYKYYYNGDYVVNETRNGSNFATNVYGVDGPISRQYSGMEHYYFKNAHGDVIYAFTSGKWRSSEYSYSAYGEEGVSYDYYSANPNPIRYSGEYFDTESGMTYLRARYYDPFQRRFISEDPIRDGANWYAYCGNNPVMFVDPTGTFNIWSYYSIGFKYDSAQDIWYSPKDCWQRYWGYNDFYDSVAEQVINIDTQKVHFNYGNKTWRIQIWKGDYGPTTGAEIGVYYKDKGSQSPHYDAVSDKDMLSMSMVVYKDGEKLFERKYNKYWWMNGFTFDEDTDPSSLKISAKITFKNYEMRKAFVDAYINQYGSSGISYSLDDIYDNTVLIDWEG